MDKNLTQEQLCLLDLLKNSISTADNTSADCGKKYDDMHINWLKVFKMAQKHAVISLMYEELRGREDIPYSLISMMQDASKRTVLQNYRLIYLSGNITDMLKRENITALLLKGASAARFYPIPELRKSGDVDLLVKDEEALERACEILEAHGYRRHKEQHANHHVEFSSGEGISIELHGMLTEPFDNAAVNKYLLSLTGDYIQNCEITNILGYQLYTAGRPYDAFYLLLHMLQHFLRAGFGLKLLCDWVCMWNQGMDEQECTKFMELVNNSRIFGFAQLITAMCVQYLGLDADKVSFMKPDRCAYNDIECLMNEILEAEEFGKSDNSRMVMMRGNSLKDYIREFHHQMRLNHPKSSACPLLWPVLWIVTLIVFIKNNHKIRNTSSLAILRNAGRRSRIMKNMDLFVR